MQSGEPFSKEGCPITTRKPHYHPGLGNEYYANRKNFNNNNLEV
jgi:hypothetical protein